MSKREIQLYEVLDRDGATVAFEHTIPRARRVIQTCPGAKFQTINVPLRPDQLSAFLTEKAGGAG